MPTYAKPPAFGKALIGRRKLGERIGLLVVAVHDWDAGKELASRSGTARVVVDVDQLPHELDWSCAVALDCLIVGGCAEAVFYATATMLFAAGAASIWGEFEDGIWRLERWPYPGCPSGFLVEDGPVPAARFGTKLAAYRSWALLTRAGVYGTRVFDAARDAEYAKAFGPLAEKAQAWVGEKRGFDQPRTA
jgi:hypothetical protein